MCRMVSPEKHVPAGITIDIREMYKEIRNRLTEIKAIEQLLQGKYRQYYRRDALRDKEIMEFGFIVKNCYSKFEYTIVQIEAIKRLKERAPTVDHPAEPPQWFHQVPCQSTRHHHYGTSTRGVGAGPLRRPSSWLTSSRITDKRRSRSCTAPIDDSISMQARSRPSRITRSSVRRLNLSPIWVSPAVPARSRSWPISVPMSESQRLAIFNRAFSSRSGIIWTLRSSSSSTRVLVRVGVGFAGAASDPAPKPAKGLEQVVGSGDGTLGIKVSLEALRSPTNSVSAAPHLLTTRLAPSPYATI